MSLNSDHHIIVALFFQGENFSFFLSFLSDGTTQEVDGLDARRTEHGNATPERAPLRHPISGMGLSCRCGAPERTSQTRGCCSDATAVDSCGTSSRMQQQQIGGEQQDAAAADGRPGPW